MLLILPGLVLLGASDASAAAPTRGTPSGGTDGWWFHAMKIGAAQQAGLTGKGVTVAMLDGNITVKPRELSGAHISLRQTCSGARVSQRPGSYSDHGTSMAAMVVGDGHGTGPGGAGIEGVAPDARLLFYGLNQSPPAGGLCVGLDAARMVDQAVNAGADIITMSYGSSGAEPAMERAVHRAIAHGVAVVASSGATYGDGANPTVVYPAGFPGVIAVNAVDRSAKPWRGNPAPDGIAPKGYPVISAPGVHVNALLWMDGGWESNAWGTGTSPATAIVAGCLALVKQRYPKATGNQLVQDLIHFTGGAHGARKYGWDPHYGFGIASVTEMLRHDPTKWPDVNPLLQGPDAAYKDFPMSMYGNKAAIAAADRAAASGAAGSAKRSAASTAPGASPSVSAMKSVGASPSTAAGGSTSGAVVAAPASPGRGGGVPSWVWVIVALVVLAGAGSVVVVTRRRGSAGPGTPGDSDGRA